MNILVLAADYPVTTRMAGSPRLFNLCRHIAHRHDLTLAFFRRSKDREAQFANDPDNRDVFQNLVALPSADASRLSEPTWLGRQLHRFTFEPYYSMRKLQPRFVRSCQEKVTQVIAERQIDLIYVDAEMMLQYVASTCDVPIVVDFCDCDSLVFRQNARLERRPFHRIKSNLETQGIVRWERETARRAEISFVVSPQDEKGLQRSYPQARTLVVPNGIDSSFFSPRESANCAPRTGKLVFSGVMRYAPNAEAAIFFATEVFPRVRRDFPAAEFWIVGADPPESVSELGRNSGVHVTGTVPDVRPYIHSSDVFVCPLRYGTGIKNKLLATLSMQVPTVATPHSMLGLEAVNEEHLLAAHTAEEFAGQIGKLLTSPDLADRLAANGRRLIEQRYAWSTYAALLEQALSDVTRGRTGDAPVVALHCSSQKHVV